MTGAVIALIKGIGKVATGAGSAILTARVHVDLWAATWPRGTIQRKNND
jgi:hypothetical protein